MAKYLFLIFILVVHQSCVVSKIAETDNHSLLREAKQMPLLTKNFIYVRHGSTDWSMDQVNLGHKDYGLNAVGREEAEKVAINISFA